MRRMDGFISSSLALVVLALHLSVDGCSAVNLEGSILLKFQSRVEEDPYGAMVGWSPRDSDPCSWNGVRCVDGRVVTLNLKDLSLRGTLGPELGTLSHLRALLLSNNCFQWPLTQHSYGNYDQENDFNIYDNLGRGNMNRRAENGLESGSSSQENKKDTSNLSGNPTQLPSQHEPRNTASHLTQRRTTSEEDQETRSIKWLYVIVLPLVALLMFGIACMLLLCRTKSGTTIGPWKTGLSGQLQKAFVTGVPKLQRSELEGACEDFSNIVASYPQYTVYKGTLSSGVEIAVVSTMIISSKDWSKHSEGRFRKKIDSLSRINHKNYINLLGYCEEEEPFMRMMVMEYAPNGTLYEHLHVEGFDPIDWNGRMRVIMGVAYCTLHMHELSPPITHPDIKSSAILLSEDGAAKIVDMSVWHEVYSRENVPNDDDLVDHPERVAADPAGNIYSFGLLMLEIISGKPPYSKEKGSLLNLALECIRDNRNMSCLLDPNLKDHKEKDLEIICDLLYECIQSDPKKRPTMREVTTRLREVLSISPEAATPRLSPLWWAELEILSVEAS
uniref:Protein kinase domain-containing protein n=1 Tax=Zea mays TaxID=4577 RepID=A0A804NFC3_MAIZE